MYIGIYSNDKRIRNKLNLSCCVSHLRIPTVVVLSEGRQVRRSWRALRRLRRLGLPLLL